MKRLRRAASRAISGCLSFSLIPLLLSEASLRPFTSQPDSFRPSHFYKRALRLPTSFPISGMVRYDEKPRLYRSSWRAFASTYPLMLPSTSKEALLVCPPSPPWNLPSFTVESTLSSPCYRSDSLLFRQGVALVHLDTLPPHRLVLWTNGFVPFGKGGSDVLANCSLCGTEATLSFLAGPVF